MPDLETRSAILEAVGHAIASPAPMDRLLELVTDMLLQAAPSEAATVFLLDPADNTLRFAVTRGPKRDELAGLRIPLGQGIVGWVAQHDRYALVPDVASDPRFSQEVDKATGFATRALLCVPLHTRHGVIGVVEFINPTRGEFTDKEATFVASIANQAAQLIENVRLSQEREQHVAALNALRAASRWLNSSLHIETVLQKIVETADEVIQAQAGSILLKGKDGLLDFTVALGPAGQRLMDAKGMLRDRLNEGIAAWVAENGKAEIIADCTKDTRFTSGPGPEIHDKLGFQTQSMVCVPMRARGEVVGVVELINRLDGKPFDQNDLDTLSVFADDAAAALTNARLYESLEDSYRNTINSLATALDLRDNETGGHSQRVALFAQEVAQRLGLPKAEVDDTYQGSLLHDIGKIGIPDSVLLKPGKLTDDEWLIMRRHIVIGYRLLDGIDFLSKSAVIPLFHHERYDGKGYLTRLKGDQIPVGARIFAIIDAYDAMTSDRPYRKALGDEVARQRIRESCGTQFDPEIAEVFLNIPRATIDAIRKKVEKQQAEHPSQKAVNGHEEEDIKVAREAAERLKALGVI